MVTSWHVAHLSGDTTLLLALFQKYLFKYFLKPFFSFAFLHRFLFCKKAYKPFQNFFGKLISQKLILIDAKFKAKIHIFALVSCDNTRNLFFSTNHWSTWIHSLKDPVRPRPGSIEEDQPPEPGEYYFTCWQSWASYFLTLTSVDVNLDESN